MSKSLKKISDWEAVPFFKEGKEENQYWQTHQIGADLIRDSLMNDDTSESTTITLRMHPRMLSRIKRIARQRYLNYQSMLKQWLSERVEQETK